MNLKKNKIFLLVLLVLSILPVLYLFLPGFPITHDGQDHVARIANFYQSLTEGNLIPRWAANLNWGYGHPILEFLYPFPSYVASFFHFVGFSLVDSTKIVFILGMFLSLPFMYLWLSQFCSKYAALFGAVLYTYAPYRFVETYVRGDIGENLAFAFVPLVLYFMYKVYKNKSYNYLFLGSFSLALLIVSHNAISLMLSPFIFLYALILIYISKKKREIAFKLGLQILLGFTLSMFFWLPALLEGKYTLRNIVTRGGYVGRFVDLKSIIYGSWSYGITGQFTVQFGPFQWLAILLSPVTIFLLKKNKEKYLLSILLLIYTLVSIFLMFPISDVIWSRITLLQNFQFPWRFLGLIIFTSSVLASLFLDVISKKINVKLVVLVSILIVVLISSFYWKPRAYQQKPESFYTGVYESTTDTGESAPIWSVRFMEERPNAHMEVVDGKATIKEIERKSNYHKYEVNVLQKTLFRENTLYFPGWQINANGVSQNIEFQNMTYRGVMLFFLDKGNYIVETEYKETKLRLVSDIISLISIIGILIFILFRFVKPKFS
jgi:uncharacterized membrane protein